MNNYLPDSSTTGIFTQKSKPALSSSKSLNFTRITLSLLLFVTLAGFELNYPLVYLIWGRWDAPFGIEAITSIPLTIIGFFTIHHAFKEVRSVFILFLLFVFWAIFGGVLVHDTPLKELKNPLVLLAIMAGSYFLFSRHWEDIFPVILYIFWGVMICYTSFMLSQYVQGNFEYMLTGTQGIYLQRIQVGGVLPTEAATVSIFLLGYMLYSIRVGFLRLLSSVFAFLAVSFIVYTGSKGAIICLIIVFLIFIIISRKTIGSKSIFYFLSFLIFAVPFILFYENFKSIIFLSRFSTESFLYGTDSRVDIYSLLLTLIQENPLWGVGIGQFFKQYYINVAHHNYLGIAAEMGIPAAIFFTISMVAALYSIITNYKTGPKLDNEDVSVQYAISFYETMFYVILFIQLRGFFHDTWSYKETYFLIGAGLGLKHWIKVNKIKPCDSVCKSNPVTMLNQGFHGTRIGL